MTSLNIPKHIAVIMDGNGRWAKKRGLPRISGHYEGVKRAEELVDTCLQLGVKYLTLFTFSTENWKRPKEEVGALFELFESYFKRRKEDLIKKGIRLKFIGRRDRLPKRLVQLMEELEEDSKECNNITVCIAIDYGGRDDILRAVKKVLH
ncbi:MAG: polyprenyl diphosphate synthase, partial [Hydrogenobacter sp.]